MTRTCSVEPLTYGSARDNGQPDTSDDSEDSNDEGNWRNDYPDTEEEDADDGNDGDNDSVDERDMRRAFGSMEMGMLQTTDARDEWIDNGCVDVARRRRRRSVQR